LEQVTYLPEDAGQLADVLDFLAAHSERRGARPTPTYALSGPGPGDRVEVPQRVHEVLVHVVQALRAGRAVSVVPQSTLLTTQQAAELLNVSRPTLVKLLDDGHIPFERLSTRRQVRLADVLAYRTRRRQEQYAALAATSDELDDSEDPEVVRARLKAIRKTVAARRRHSAGQGPASAT
jgi:excisionase family DNA binding protein